MKIIASAALVFAASATVASAADCSFGKTEYEIHWTSFAMQDADPSGRPTRAYAFPADPGFRRADPIMVHFGYGMARRFEFDSPKVVDIEGSSAGAMVIKQNLLRPFEMTETQIYFEAPVSDLKVEVHDVDDNAKFGRSFYDKVSLIGRKNNGKIADADVGLLNIPAFQANPLLAYERDRGLAGDNLYPLNVRAVNGKGYAPYLVSFDDKIKDVAIRVSSTDGPGPNYSVSSNPSPQEIKIGRVSFCMPK
jgi:hypothetical protein